MILSYAIAEGYLTREPARGSERAAGLDVYVPEFTKTFLTEFTKKNPGITITESKIELPPHARVIIPTGIRFNIPEETYLEVANRGSVAALQGLVYGAHIVDSDYQGIVFINLINTSTSLEVISSGNKLVQLIHKEYIHSNLSRVNEDELYTTTSKRGAGALGSTGR